METFELDELRGEAEFVPSPIERRSLVRAADRLDLAWGFDGSVRIRPAGYVGSIRLSNDRMLRVKTKMPVDRVLELASLAFRTMPIPSSFGSTQLSDAEPLDWVVTLLVFEIEALLRREVRQGYVEVTERMPYVRGRIRFAEQAGSFSNPALVACEFSDFLVDTLENRILKSTLEMLATSRIHPVLRLRALELASLLGGVGVIGLTGAVFDRVHLTSLTAAYGPSLRLSRLWFEGSGLSEKAGDVDAPAFFFPMEKVFEAGIANLLRSRFPDVRTQVGRSLTPSAGGPRRPFNFIPDVVIGSPPRLVLDTKYARAERPNRHGGASLKNEHAYQIAFYSRDLGCPGVLVYPRDDADIDVTFEIGDMPFTFLTVDLRSDERGLDDLTARIGILADGN